MDIKNCKNCGKIYNYYGGNLICPSCQKKLEEQFKLVKQYIYDNEDMTAEEVSKALDIPIKQIYNWIREERLSFKKESIGGISCERCGNSIKTGRFCDKCKMELCQSFSSKRGQNKEQINSPMTNEQMHFLGKK